MGACEYLWAQYNQDNPFSIYFRYNAHPTLIEMAEFCSPWLDMADSAKMLSLEQSCY